MSCPWWFGEEVGSSRWFLGCSCFDGWSIWLGLDLGCLWWFFCLVSFTVLFILGTLDVMISRMRSFWWAKKSKDHGLAMVAWDSLCTPKGMGGIGFRDLRLFNIALLGRQVWWLINNKDTLCYRVLSSKYFSDGICFTRRLLISLLSLG